MNIIDVVKKLAPSAKENYLEAIEQADSLFAQHEINTPLRIAHFLAQALHETGGFTILRENMNYSAPRLIEIFGVGHHSAKITESDTQTLAHHPEAIAERVYGLGNPKKAHELGNTHAGDGFRYRGNGVLQTTGRGAHQRMGKACGVDFENNPDLVTTAQHALKPALQEWTDGNLNFFADKNDIRTITKRINGGYNGFDERVEWFDKLWALLKDEKHPAESWQAGNEDEDVKWLQEALNKLGADPKLAIDGRYGPGTKHAVKNFQASVNITADGIAGPVTKEKIELKLKAIA